MDDILKRLRHQKQIMEEVRSYEMKHKNMETTFKQLIQDEETAE